MKALPTLGFSEAVKRASGRLFDFKGRSRRSEFWWWMLLVIIASKLIPMFIFNIVLNLAASVGIMFFGLSVTVRRLHDTGKSGWWVYASYALSIVLTYLTVTSTTFMGIMASVDKVGSMYRLIEENMGELVGLSLCSLLTTVISIIVIILCLLDSTPAANKYGDSPKYIEE